MDASTRRDKADWPLPNRGAGAVVRFPRRGPSLEPRARSLVGRGASAAPNLWSQRLSRAGKRALDVCVALTGLVCLAPVMFAIAAAVALTSPGPVIFNSPRVGRYGRIFMMPKFRTMHAGSDVAPRERLAGGGQRLTPIGGFLRRTGLDELPQLFCVLSGDMSVIGPRPLLVDDPALLEREKFPSALQVRPGISGLAQVSGRNLVPARRKARLDAFYARSASLRFDLVLLVKTIGVVLSGRGFL